MGDFKVIPSEVTRSAPAQSGGPSRLPNAPGGNGDPASVPGPSTGATLDAQGEQDGRVAQLLDNAVLQQLLNSRLRIERHDESGRFVYKSIDAKTGEVLNQFPSEKLLRILSAQQEAFGTVFDDKA